MTAADRVRGVPFGVHGHAVLQEAAQLAAADADLEGRLDPVFEQQYEDWLALTVFDPEAEADDAGDDALTDGRLGPADAEPVSPDAWAGRVSPPPTDDWAPRPTSPPA